YFLCSGKLIFISSTSRLSSERWLILTSSICTPLTYLLTTSSISRFIFSIRSVVKRLFKRFSLATITFKRSVAILALPALLLSSVPNRLLQNPFFLLIINPQTSAVVDSFSSHQYDVMDALLLRNGRRYRHNIDQPLNRYNESQARHG